MSSTLKIASWNINSIRARLDIVEKFLVEAAPDRVLWGTDFPHPNSTHDADEADLVDLVPQFATSAQRQQAVLVDNPARLYGF